MGLSVRYELAFKGTLTAARPVLVALREHSLNLGFAVVSDLIHAVDAAPRRGLISPEESRALANGNWNLSVPNVENPAGGPLHVHVPPLELLEFHLTAPGLEYATLGLAAHPPHPAWPELHTLLRWKSVCCTQPAGHARLGGVQHFLKVHRLVLQVLRQAETLGLVVTVQDDGNYWATQDQKALIDSFHHWEELAAGLHRRRVDGAKPATLAADVLPTLKPRNLMDSSRTHPDT